MRKKVSERRENGQRQTGKLLGYDVPLPAVFVKKEKTGERM